MIGWIYNSMMKKNVCLILKRKASEYFRSFKNKVLII